MEDGGGGVSRVGGGASAEEGAKRCELAKDILQVPHGAAQVVPELILARAAARRRRRGAALADLLRSVVDAARRGVVAVPVRRFRSVGEGASRLVDLRLVLLLPSQ